MAPPKNQIDTKLVTDYIQKLDPPLAKMLEAIRQLILKTDHEIGEHIKWNSPSFYYTGEMKPFDPKEYKRDIVVMNLRKGIVLLIFPTGMKVNDKSGLLEGDYKDGRRMASFQSLDDVKDKGKALQMVIKKWLDLIEK